MHTTTDPTTNPTLNPSLTDALERLVEAVGSLQTQQENLWQQSEALTRLLAYLQPNAPFPPTRGWAASPDFLLLLAETILEIQPTHIVEASSGVTTLVSAYCLKRLGSGHVTSLEHDPEYAAKTTSLLQRHNLTAFASVLHTPLIKHTIDGDSYQWYDAPNIDAIDLLVVDGPPAKTGPLARYPALPLFKDAIGSGATILVDDGARPPEEEMVKRWCAANPAITKEYFNFEKGAFRLRC